MSEENVAVIRRSNTAWNAGDTEAILALLDPDIEFIDHLPLPDVAQAGRGTHEVETILAAWREGFAGFRADVEEYVDLGDFVVCTTNWRFVSQDQGIELHWRGAEAYEIREGRLAWAHVGLASKEAAVEAVEKRIRGAD